MQSKTVTIAGLDGLASGSSRRALPAVILLVAAMIVAITAATALPSRSPDTLHPRSSKDAAPSQLLSFDPGGRSAVPR